MSGKDARSLDDYLGHIIEAIERINRYTHAMDAEAFFCDELVQDAVIRNLEIIGEASRNLSVRFPDFAKAHPGLPLAFAYQMRNAVAHGYFQVDLGVVWKTITTDLPAYCRQIQAVRREGEGRPEDPPSD
jgi:uncharacterized protein with HEPN domain